MNRNDELFERAQISIPGGVNSPVRAFRSVGGSPRFMNRAQGPYMWDVEEKRFTDYVCSWGPMILGHGNPEVLRAVHEAVDAGLTFGTATELEIQIAEEIRRLVPSIESVRLVSSGTEAGMSAIRLACGYTGRNKIIKFEGCYHGHSDRLLVKAGSGMLTFGHPSSAGVPAGITNDTIVLEYNNPAQLEETFKELGDQIAGVIVEAVGGNMNMVKGTPEFIHAIRDLCTKYGAVMIVDEVMTGFRVALGGAQSVYPVAVTAGLKTLQLIQEPGFYDRITATSKRLTEGLTKAAADNGIPFTADYCGGMFGIYFLPEVPHRFADVMKSDDKLFGRWFHQMLDAGCYFAPSVFEAGFVSIVHTDEVIDQTIAAARDAFASLRAAV